MGRGSRLSSNSGWLAAMVASGALGVTYPARAQQPGATAAPGAPTPAGTATAPASPPPGTAGTAAASGASPAPAAAPPDAVASPGPASPPPGATAPPPPPPPVTTLDAAEDPADDTDERDYFTTYPYRTGQPVPAGYHVEEHGIKGLVIAGAITFGATYFVSLAVAPNQKYLNWLAVPIVGPYVSAERVEQCGDGYYDEVTGRWVDPQDDSDCVIDADEAAAVLRLDGFTQATGVALFAVGMLVRRQRLVPDPPRVALQIVPYRVGRNGYALGVTGRF